MLTPTVKHIFKVIFVVIVIAGLLASYLFTGAPRQVQTTEQPAQEGFKFINPGEQPTATDPSGAPTVNGPATPPPTGSN